MYVYNMPRGTRKIKLNPPSLCFFLGLSLIIGLCGCDSPASKLKFPENPVLGMKSRWGVVNSAYLRVKAEASSLSADIAYLRRGEIVEILATNVSLNSLAEESGRWHELRAEGLRGWAYSGYLQIFDSRQKALTASDALGK